MKARQCAGCAAPLPAGDLAQSVTCRFCGMVHDPAIARPPGVRIDLTSSRPRRSAGKLVGILIVVAIILTLVPVVMVVFIAWRAETVISDALTTAGPAVAARTAALTASDLKRPIPSGPQVIDVAAPAAGFGATDAVTLLPWALTIAQNWQPDARLRRIDAARVRPDGTLNLVDDADAEVRYRFESPGQIDELRRQADVSASAEVTTEFWVSVKRGKANVQAISRDVRMLNSRDLTLPPHPKVLSSTALWARLAGRAGFDAPFMSGYLIHLDEEGWVWYLSSMSGQNHPRVRATDGRSYPYK